MVFEFSASETQWTTYFEINKDNGIVSQSQDIPDDLLAEERVKFIVMVSDGILTTLILHY